MNLSPEQLAQAAEVILAQRKATLAERTRPIVAVLPADKMGCGYIRMIVPFHALRDRGWDVVFVDRILTEEGVEENRRKGIEIYDLGHVWTSHRGVPYEVVEPEVVVMQRQTSLDKLEAARAMQARGAKIVFEFDDSFHTVPHDNPNAKDLGVGKSATVTLEKFVGMADLVMVSTQSLAEEYGRFADPARIVVCENSLDDRQFARFARPLTGEPKRTGQLRIGWGGSATHVEDFRPLVKPMCKLMDEFPEVRIVFIGADMRALFPRPYFHGAHMAMVHRNRVEFAGMTHAEGAFISDDAERDDLAPLAYYDLVDKAALDIAVAPIRSMTFNRSKSWIKVLEYGMLGIPAVASRFGPYADYNSRSDGVCIETAAEPNDWHRVLRRLIMFPEERARLAQRNRANVERQHLINTNIVQWENALRALLPVTV